MGALDRRVFLAVQEKLDNVIETPRKKTEIDVWLDSPGGDAHVAYKLFLELRSRCARLRVVVPDFAKSAATLLAIGADEIWMAPAAELGPLDAQIEHPDREGVSVSALDVADAVEFLMRIAVKHLLLSGGYIVKSTGLARASVLEQFAKFSAEFFRPLIGKLDPHLVHKAANELVVAGRYATSMLRMRGKVSIATPNGKEPLSAVRVARCLVEDYPSHGFVISRTAIKNLGLPVYPISGYNYWGQAKALYFAYSHGQFAKDTEESQENHLIDVWSLADLNTRFPNEDANDAEPEDSANDNNQGKTGESSPAAEGTP